MITNKIDLKCSLTYTLELICIIQKGKYIMKKNIILAFLVILVLFSACKENPTTVDKASVRLTIDGVKKATRTIVPDVPEFDKFTVKLKAGGEDKYTQDFDASSSIVLNDVRIGTYDITVDAYSSDSLIASGSSRLEVKPVGVNSATIKLDYSDKGKGSFSVTIDWSELSLDNDNPLANAINSNLLGFVAYDQETNAPYSDAQIQWVTDFTKKEYTYTQQDVPTTKGDRIFFRIYTRIDNKEQAIADTFNTSIIIVPNVTSIVDSNEKNNFKLSDENIISYISNVTDVSATINSEDPAHKIDIAWKYPKLAKGNYTLTLWLTDNTNNNVVGDKKTISYTDADTDGKATFDSLDPNNTYSVHFKNAGDVGYSTELVALDNIRTKVKVESIAFKDDFKSEYTMGDSVQVDAVTNPSDATFQDYTVTAEGLTVEGKTVVFAKSGDYTITITNKDDNTKTASKTVTVKLKAPTLSLEKTESGVKLSWNKVDSATSYVITKSPNEEKEIKSEENTYIDSEISTGVDYTYSVKAIREDRKFDSVISNEAKTKIDNSTIQIELPAKIESSSFLSVIENALNGKYVTDEKGFDISIDEDTLKNTTSAESYTWYVNGNKIAENTSKITIDKDTIGLNTYSNESTNTLELAILKDGFTYSASANFNYIATDPGEINISGEGRVVYGNPITLTASTDNGNPRIIFSSSDEKIATVNSKGVVSAIADGKVTITAKIASTGKTVSKELTSIATEMSINAPTNWMIVEKNGVEVKDTNYKEMNLSSYLNKNYLDGKEDTNSTYTWASSNSSVISVTDQGVVKPLKSGEATITVTKDGAATTSIKLTAYDFDIYYDGKAVTGTEKQLKCGVLGDENYDVFVAINSSQLNSNWPLADFEWSAELKGYGTYVAFSLTNEKYKAKISIGLNEWQYLIKASIKVNNKEVGVISFTRN